MDTSRFTALFGSPRTHPIGVDWPAVEAWLGHTLPTDYKLLADAYGQFFLGADLDYVQMCTPCVVPSVHEYGQWLRQTHRLCRSWSRDVPPHVPPAFHPQAGGLLAWGQTGRGTSFFWDTSASSDPDRWPVVIFHTGTLFVGREPWAEWKELWRHYDMSVTETLIRASEHGIELPRGEVLGPLQPRLVQQSELREVLPWAPPKPKPELVPAEVRRKALSEGSGLDALTLIQPPPEQLYVGEGTWEQLYADLGTRLPAEYVALMETYGAGTWSEWLYFYVPLRRGGKRFVWHLQQMTDGYLSLRAEFPEYHPLPMWPEPGGFLMFACTSDGDEIGWLTDGDPDDWPVIVVPRHADQGPALPGSLTHILLQWIRGRFSTEGFPPIDELDDPLEEVSFKPSHEKAYW